MKVGDIGFEEFQALIKDIKDLVHKQREALDNDDLSLVRALNTEIKSATEFMSRLTMDDWRGSLEGLE